MNYSQMKTKYDIIAEEIEKRGIKDKIKISCKLTDY